ncbi:DNA repair protein RecO [Aurantibacter sp.]|uniref:DNA repair protein RecO n=1 Tax=Aurantibacter sp. TaxID=2807103 RepID=UPI0035C848CE
MVLSLNAIVLSKIKFKENDLIVKTYTKQKGVISYILKGVLSSKKNKKIAYFQLLSQLEIETNFKANRNLHYLKDCKNHHLYRSLHTNIYKSTIALFIAEILTLVLNEEEQNDMLFSYIESSLLWLDLNTELANFHLLFLMNLTKYLGFYPDDTNQNFNYFNLNDGEFQLHNSSNSISLENLSLFKAFLGINFDEINKIKINAQQRTIFLNTILKYYEFQLLDFRKPKSLKVLNDVFS